MLRAAGAALLLLAAGGSDAAQLPRPDQYAQVIIREQILVRVPVRLRESVPPGAEGPDRWKEKKGPKCVAARSIVRAGLAGEKAVDLVLRDGSRIRAKLENNCPALDYYYGFYVNPTPDGMICADRDIIRSRVGGQCGIERFRSLELAHRD